MVSKVVDEPRVGLGGRGRFTLLAASFSASICFGTFRAQPNLVHCQLWPANNNMSPRTKDVTSVGQRSAARTMSLGATPFSCAPHRRPIRVVGLVRNLSWVADHGLASLVTANALSTLWYLHIKAKSGVSWLSLLILRT